MCSRVYVFLIGVVFIYYQVLAAEDVFVGELMVESNVTLDAQTVLSVLNSTADLTVKPTGEDSHTVTITLIELVAECVIIGLETTCTCSTGYMWSNNVCYNYSCCTEHDCTKNVSHLTPLCIEKAPVRLNGSVTVTTDWGNFQTTTLEKAFAALNGFEFLNVTGQREQNKVADFETLVSVKFPTAKLQEVVAEVENNLTAVVKVDTEGMINIESPDTTVCYESDPELKCMFEEATGGSAWYKSQQHKRFELNNGSVVELNHFCATDQYKSCSAVTLRKVTGIWSGSYECSFTSGSIRHTAKTSLDVVLLPDVITMRAQPLTADCSQKSSGTVPVTVTAIISNSTESFEVEWRYNDQPTTDKKYTPDGDELVYTSKVSVSCEKTPKEQSVEISFNNSKAQIKTARVVIPVIYVGKSFCSEDLVDGAFWPKTPTGDTAINRTCEQGRVGYKSRTCEGTTWKLVFDYCVNEELNKVVNAADNFLKGLGATQAVAMDIFEGLKNTSTSDTDSTDSIADIAASVNVLELMADASENFNLKDDVLPNFIHAASSMLNKSWVGVNESKVHEMSSEYLQSVESLVKNIKVNTSNGVDSPNLDLKFCTDMDCHLYVFDVGVNLNKSGGIMKSVAVKNLMSKLNNDFRKADYTSSLLVSTTLDETAEQPVDITITFPKEQEGRMKLYCVFWHTKERKWSDKGCKLKPSRDNTTVCECNHLTSFSVLMAKGDISTDVLDMITNVGLGVSICSLLIFLIVESLVWSAVVKSNLSHFRHTAIVNIAVFLLLADICFLASSSPETLSDTLCFTFTVCKHLFFLVMFSWMLCLSVMLVHQLIFVFSPLRKRVFMFFASIVGYVCPILIVGSSYVYCKYTDRKYYNKETCWLVFDRLLEGSIHAFLLPVGTVILINLFSMVVVILTLVKSSVPEGSKAEDKETAKSILKVVVFLTPVFGVTWIIGFALLLLDQDNPMFDVASYAFTILNSFQGLFLLITGCIAEQKVREEMLRIIMAKSKGNSDSTKNLTSTMYTKDK